MSDPTGLIFDIQRFSIHDGPGIRTTVFFKGCPLRCLWCHNPEGISPRRHLSFVPAHCIGCGYCVRVCPRQVHVMDPEKGHLLRRERCLVCGECTRQCYAKALEVVGREVSVAEVLSEVLRDRAFYETSGGGMTLSGGEPLMQIEFTAALLRAARAEGLHTVVETCGHVPWEHLERVLADVNLFLYDVKETDPERHVRFTGVPSALIQGNLRTLHARGGKIIVRLPIIPGLNDRLDHFAAVAELAHELPGLLGFEIMPYHRLGTAKRERMGLSEEGGHDFAAPEPEQVAAWAKDLRSRGVKVLNEA
jgi:pyruvate formate lyase activating enzyme